MSVSVESPAFDVACRGHGLWYTLSALPGDVQDLE
jgi:hypothetical protein